MNIRMTTKGKRPLRSLTPSDKIHAIQRIHDGESKASVARDIGVPESTLRGWCKNEDKLRFMSRQSASDKMAADSLTDKLVDGATAAAAALLGGPPEKRQKLDPSIPLNYSNKMKYEELAYKRSPLNGLDFSTNKALSDLSFNSLGPDYNAFKNAELAAMNGAKNKGYGADLSRQNDPSLAAISPLSSLSHLSGLTGLGHSPLAISFSELTSNLNLIAQLNPSLAATMSGLNGLTANSLRNMKPKGQSMHSPRSNDGDRVPQGISVKNWAKQKNANDNYSLNLSANDKNKIKCPSPSLAPSLGTGIPAMDDPLLYWLKSQQAMLGLNSLYPPNPPTSSSPPIRSSTPQQHAQTSTPPISSTPQTPSSTPSGSLDDKNSAWFNWCKAFGASLNSLAPHGVLQPTASSLDGVSMKPQFENILYSHLTKESSSPHSTDAMNNNNNNEVTSNSKPEDLSAKSAIAKTPSPPHSPIVKSEADTVSTNTPKDALDNILFKLNHNNNNSTNNENDVVPNNNENSTDDNADADREAENNSSAGSSHNMQVGTDSDASYNSDSINNSDNHHNNNNSHSNNNNNSNKTDEEERAKYASDAEDIEAIEHGEKFLKWLENCSNPRVTSVQLMQLRFLISAIKSGNEKQQAKDSDEENKVTKIRRRK